MRLPKCAKYAPAAYAAFAVLLCIGLASNAMLISPGNLNLGSDSIYRPYCYGWLAEKFGTFAGENAARAEGLCGGFEGENRERCYWGAGLDIGYNELFAKRCAQGEECGSSEHLRNAVEKCGRFPDKYRDSCYGGLVWGIANAYGSDIGQINRLCGELDNVCEDCCAEGAGIFTPQSLENCGMLSQPYKETCYYELGMLENGCGNFPQEFYGECISGMAYKKVIFLERDPAEFAPMCLELAPMHLADCCKGAMLALDELYYEFPEKKNAILRSAGPEFAAQCEVSLSPQQ